MTTAAPHAPPYRGRLTTVTVGRDLVALWVVADLESHVDRAAVLRTEAPVDPPYWAHLWSGARVLAAAIPPSAGRVLELGCGLGLPSLVAARRGATVLATDRARAPLAFVRASARANGFGRLEVAGLDLGRPGLRERFDVVLLSEVLYDRNAFPEIVETLRWVLAPGGYALLADGARIDTRAFYTLLTGAGFHWTAADFVAIEEGFPIRIRLVRISRPRP